MTGRVFDCGRTERRKNGDDHRDDEQGHVYDQAEVQGDALREVEIFFW